MFLQSGFRERLLMPLVGVREDLPSSSHLLALGLKLSLTVSRFGYKTWWEYSDIKRPPFTISTLLFSIFIVTTLVSQARARSSLQSTASEKFIPGLGIWIVPGQSYAMKQKRTLRSMCYPAKTSSLKKEVLWSHRMERIKGVFAEWSPLSFAFVGQLVNWTEAAVL